MGAKDGKSKKEKIALEDMKNHPKLMVPKFKPNPKFNTFEDPVKEDWHSQVLARGLEGEFVLYPDGTVVGKGISFTLAK